MAHYPTKQLGFICGFWLLCSSAFAQGLGEDMISEGIITDPSFSRRCETLLEELGQKRDHKQKLTELLIRNERMQKVTPTQKKQLKRHLELNYRKVERELDLTRMKIQRQEETLIRGGCPGVILE